MFRFLARNGAPILAAKTYPGRGRTILLLFLGGRELTLALPPLRAAVAKPAPEYPPPDASARDLERW
jgi:hypothetical protein